MAQAREQWYRPDEVAGLYKVTKRTVYTWIERGWLPAHTLGPSRLLRIRGADLEEFVRASDAA